MSQKFIEPSINSFSRVSHAEIEESLQELQKAFVEGRLDENECEERMTRAIKAKTKEELLVLSNDLGFTKAAGLLRLNQFAFAVFSGLEQKGQFLLPKNYRIVAIMGGCLLDLRGAVFENSVTNISVIAIMGGVQILVPKGIRVTVQGLPIMGGFTHAVVGEEPRMNALVINIRGIAIMGGVEIKTI